MFVQHFDLGFAAKSAEDFLAEIIVDAIGASHVVVGWDCTFGKSRRGTPDFLRAAGLEHGFAVTVIEPIRGADQTVYSSTHIRELLKAGKAREAAALLGRFWEIDGRVAAGDRRGRTIGFPTANLGLDDYLRPAFGVYAVRVSAATARTTRSPAARSTASPILGCARRSAASNRGSKRIFSTSMSTFTAAICVWR